MKKRLLAMFVTIMMVIPMAAQAISVSAPEDFVPGNAMMTFDFQLTGKLKTTLEPLLRGVLGSELNIGSSSNEAKSKALIDKILAGDRMFVSFSAPESIYVSFPVTDADWIVFTQETTKSEYNSVEVYTENDAYMSRLGDFAVIAPTEAEIHKAIDLATGSSTDSLNKNVAYKDFTSAYFSPRLLGLTLEWKELMDFFVSTVPGASNENSETKAIMEILGLFKMAGGSLAETTDGYKFNFKILGDLEKLRAKGISLNPTGNFTPSLYKKFPNAKPILYSEGFNAKANYIQEKKIIKDLAASMGESDVDVYESIKNMTGIDLDSIYNIFDQEFAVGLQYDSQSVLPYVTVMANVKNTRTDAVNLMDDLSGLITKLLDDSSQPEGVVTKTTTGGFTKFTLDVTKIEDYDGPPLSKIVLTLGVSDDGLMIISNYPDIEQSNKRAGFASDSAFASYNVGSLGDLTSLMYFNLRNVWGWFDAFGEWAQKIDGGQDAFPLSFYQDYYSLLEKIYGMRDVLVVSKDSEAEALSIGTLVIDSAKHKTYEQFLNNFKTSDQDGDGASDYDEMYLYNTPIDTADSNNNGISDIDELKQGMRPTGKGLLFKDVPPNQYYTSDTAFLAQRGAIAGYDDGTFKPGNLVNRAEFTAMVVKSFEGGASNMLGLGVELGSGRDVPFDDVSRGQWYYKPISKAYSAGWVSGSYNSANSEWTFRPGDNITRAEAIAILNKASAALTKSRPQASCSNSTFDDVGEEEWFCEAVANAYENGVTKGKSPGQFKPFDKLTRAEAAVMIRRTLEKDLIQAGSGTLDTEEMTSSFIDLLK